MVFSLDLSKFNEGNIIFNINDKCFNSNTYYFALDNSFDKIYNEDEKVIEILIELMKNWEKHLLKLKLNEVIFMPYSFEDEYVSFFQVVHFVNESFKIQEVFSENINGYSVNISKLDCFKLTDDLCFDELSDTVFVNKMDFINDLKKSLKDFC